MPSAERARELEVIQRAYDLILWEVPLITRFPVPYRAVLGDRMQTTLYTVLEKLLEARYDRAARPGLLAGVNIELEKARYHVRLARDLKLWNGKRQAYAAGLIDEIGRQVGGWIASCGKGKRS
jgi:hypothetical protein